MPNRRTKPTEHPDSDVVLKLAEAAEFLGVSENDLVKVAENRDIPAQRIGGEWLFLKRALLAWLSAGPHFREWQRNIGPNLFIDREWMEKSFAELEQRLLRKLSTQPAEKGTASAILKHAGVFKDDSDMEEFLDSVAKQRNGASRGTSG